MIKNAIWLLFAAGCALPSDGPAPAPERRSDRAPAIEAQDARWRKIAEELTRGLSVAEQERRLVAEQHYQAALAWMNRGDFDKARAEAQQAVQGWPELLAARKLLADLHELILGGPAITPGIEEHDLRIARVTIELQKLEIAQQLLQGRRFLDAGMNASALREFESAEFKIRSLPTEVNAMNDLLPELRELSVRARRGVRP